MNIQPEQPTSIWKRPVNVKFGALAKALGKGTIAGAFGNWPGVAGSGLEIFSALGIKANDLSATAWILVQRSLLQAMSDLTVGVKGELEDPDFKMLCEQLDLVLERSEFSISQAFFQHPKDSPVVEDMKVPFRRWLQVQGLPELKASSLAERLPGYFVFALSQQWQANPDDYASLQSATLEPFRKASEREFAWHRYATWLQRRVDEPMFAEAFGLRQVYMPLRAYYDRKVKGKDDGLDYAKPQDNSKTERVVVDLQDAITGWLRKSDRTDAIRVICGGPGCGKSSFGRMLAAKLSEDKTFPVLFVPLHQLNLSDDLVDSMDEFLNEGLEDVLPPNTLTKDNAERHLLIIFDGLDELSMQGKVASQVAQDFVREVQKKLLVFNRSEIKVRVLISGRDVAIQANKSEFRKEGQILHVLPYYQTEEELKKHQYIDKAKRLGKDYRQDWWKTYGILKGKPYKGLPKELDQGKLIEITAQPLLNYLVALSYDQGDINFSEESNLNVVYNDLLKQVYKRDWADYQHPTLGSIEQKDFIRILEEIAVACWHSSGRTTTVGKIEERCAGGNLKRILGIFEGGAKEGVTRLLTAFYFRQSGLQGSEAAFEFTHKSFGEYLTVRRLVRELGFIQQQLTQHREDPDFGWDEKECLKRWIILCGPAELDEYLLSFLQDEIKRSDQEIAGQWQKTLCDLIGYMLKHGMPIEALDPRPKFIEEIKMYRNASETLLAMLSSCAWVTEELSDIKWSNTISFGEWLTILQRQRIGRNNPIAFNCLNHLNLSGRFLTLKDLFMANLDGASLYRAMLDWATLHEATLVGANLSEVRLSQARLSQARLSQANLSRANFVEANLSRANFVEANLSGANLSGANLSGANLEQARLDGANLEQANLAGILWDKETSWKDVKGIDKAQNIPQELRQHLTDLGILPSD